MFNKCLEWSEKNLKHLWENNFPYGIPDLKLNNTRLLHNQNIPVWILRAKKILLLAVRTFLGPEL